MPLSPARRLLALRKRLTRLKGSNYDISNRCNLQCEGCLYFSKPADQRISTEAEISAWDDLFRAEAARGINFAYLAGAEPSMVPEHIERAAAHIPQGVIFTNGTKRIPTDISYRIHVSMWGLGETNAALRGADVNRKALRNYAGDPRALFTFTVSALNIDQIVDAARLCSDHGVDITYSFYSATEEYNRQIARSADPGDPYFRVGTAENDPRHTQASLALARARIAEALALFPETVVYSLHYNDWISQPMDMIYAFDEAGVAIDCGNRLTGGFEHFTSDATRSAGKCCSPNIDCKDCRAYAMGWATYFNRFTTFKSDPDSLEAWVDGLYTWTRMFLPKEG
ncbi:MAG: hypothetical protein AAGM84_07055 [Pseudomonadota bacterium]